MRRAASGVLVTVRLKCVNRGSNEIIETGIDVTAQRRLEGALKRAEHFRRMSSRVVGL
jgi:hypothetical protein